MKKTYNSAPGNILQNMYLNHRLIHHIVKKKAMKFIEVGSGNGNISRILLNNGLSGIGTDLSKTACRINEERNQDFIKHGLYEIRNMDFFDISGISVDLILSSHVIEHLSEKKLNAYFVKCQSLLKEDGVIISLVPAGMKFWGIEDETAGHYRRFEYCDFKHIAEENDFAILTLSGLTCPLSNVLLGLSNFLIKKNDAWKKNLTKEAQTILSSSGGGKKVMYKTDFPYWFRFIMNEITLYPFYALQLLFRRSKNSMVLYCEYKVSQ
ncbi:SAM-dependent methyltransferase [Desulfobacter sp.]|uniref:SAM-dependent methyltransferase n=1 Tax=Desulfobacter sp. TaxID=2294 RepID=UPI003D0FC39F